MGDQQWPTDERFRRIAAKIADAVTEVLGNGGQVSSSRRECFCPLGCLADAPSRPGASWFLIHDQHGIEDMEASRFILAFDAGKESKSPWSRLGLAYRKRFP